jgi:hypothetical protein
MNPLNILYTPLDTIPIPEYNVDDLVKWIQQNQKQDVSARKDASQITPQNAYPWDITYPMTDKKWRGNFNIHFPELAEYFYKAFDLTEKDLLTVVLLPIRSDFVGEGFWHTDPDETGLRMYLENTEHAKDFLLVKASIAPNMIRDPVRVPDHGKDIRYHDTVYSAKVHTPRQVFFINNVRGIHSANVTTMGAFRIAVIVTLGKNFIDMPEHVKDLIVRSAEKFKDLAIIRPEK